MVRGKRLKQKQLAVYKKQKPRRGRPFGSRNKTGIRSNNPAMADVRFAVFLLMERGYSADAACHAAKMQYGVEFTAEMARQYRNDVYRESLRAFIRNQRKPSSN